MVDKPKIGIIGAGPGGLTTAMLLASKGFDVTVFEKNPEVGGRNGHIIQKGFTFDIGPTFLLMRFLLDQVFKESGRKSSDYLEFKALSPMYKLLFADAQLDVYVEKDKMREELAKAFSEKDAEGLDKFMKKEKVRFQRMYPCLQVPYLHAFDVFSKNMRRAYPKLSIGRNMLDVMGDYFEDERAKLTFTFQSKYLGMSPWTCPGAFAMLSYIEHKYGIDHVTGGLSQISYAMKKVCDELGVRFKFNTAVDEVVVENHVAKGIRVKKKTHEFDEVIVNADFGYAATHLFKPGTLKKWNENRVNKLAYSCSTFMLYLGIDYIPDLEHHTIVFAKDYKTNIEEVSEGKLSGENISFYVRNASVNDKTLAPKGKSALYVLVPTPNQKEGEEIDWDKEKTKMRDETIRQIEERLNVNIRDHIVTEKIITPKDWNIDFNVHFAAVFNLAHSLGQMLIFRPKNQMDEINNCFLVGGGTHPGSGLPTIYESGRIATKLICKKYGVKFTEKPTVNINE